MEPEENEIKLRRTVHDLKTTLAVMENAFNGVIDKPGSAEAYRALFEMAKQRILKEISELAEEKQRPLNK